MKELALFAGAGGGLLASLLLKWKTVGYVEKNDYCQRVIAARIKDGILDEAPIFGDVRAFIGEGFAASYTGMVDVVSAGFPCQPFSVTGRKRRQDDERNLWPETINVIRIVQPRIVWLENVTGLASSWRRILFRIIWKGPRRFRRVAIEVGFPAYLGTVLGDLAESGYDARWCCVSAADIGARHGRDRLWIYARNTLADADSVRLQGQRDGEQTEGTRGHDARGAATGSGHARSDERIRRKARWGWWAIEPGMGRMVDGVANRVDRISAIGNGQVPDVVVRAWRLLSDDEKHS